jgi:DNA-binding IscR family transcriptional regulator
VLSWIQAWLQQEQVLESSKANYKKSSECGEHSRPQAEGIAPQPDLTKETLMITVEDCIFGNDALHQRFFTTTDILAKLISTAPRAVGIQQLEEATGRPARELSKLCGSLERAGLLREVANAADKWTLACDPALITLEDVFRCVLAEQQGRSRTAAKTVVPERASNDVDLLVMQAMIAINQSVFKHLRQFSLDRLKASGSGAFPAPRRPLDDAFDITIAGHEAASVLPAQIAA